MKQSGGFVAFLFTITFFCLAARDVRGADKINTSYISTTPGSSSVLSVAKDAKIFDKHGIDATVIFISGSVRGIQSILAGEIPIGEGGGPGLASARLAGGDVVARRLHVCEVRDGQICAVTTYCNGGWNDELRARHAA